MGKIKATLAELILKNGGVMKKANICGKRVKLARVDKDMAQVDLAAALNVDFEIDITQSGISDIELGRRYVKDFELDALARVLEVDLMWLVRGKKIEDK